jgi:hypothetical protein
LKAAAGGRLDKLIDIWHRDTESRSSGRIDINLGNRRDSRSPVRGGILTDAAIEMKAEEIRLMIWYDPLELYYESRIRDAGYNGDVIAEITELLREDRDPGKEFDPVANSDKLDWDMVARQIGRWLLKFRGYKRLKNENSSYFELEAFLNIECCIPALYDIFEEADFDRGEGESKRLREVYEGLCAMEEPAKRVDRALNALRISNILEFSPDSDKKTALEALLSGRFKLVQSFIEEIDQLKKEYNLTDSSGLNIFMRKLVLKYRMPGSWVSADETAGII